MEIEMRRTIDLKAALAAATEQPSADLTLAELVRGFVASVIGEHDLRLRKWVEALGDKSAWAITSEELDVCAEALRLAGLKPATVNRDLSSLGSAYRWARAKRLTPRGFRSPTLGVQRASEDIRRVEVTPKQIAALKARALTVRDRRFGCFVHLLVDTGARKSELLERRWSEVDMVAGTITCPTTKTGVPRVLHFRPETAALMRRTWPSMHSDRLLFEGKLPGSPINFRTAWHLVVRDIGLPDLHMHDVRHCAAADLLRAGVTLAVASQVLGHSPQVLARRYGHLEVAALRQAQELRWSSAAQTP
jgi:integrase